MSEDDERWHNFLFYRMYATDDEIATALPWAFGIIGIIIAVIAVIALFHHFLG